MSGLPEPSGHPANTPVKKPKNDKKTPPQPIKAAAGSFLSSLLCGLLFEQRSHSTFVDRETVWARSHLYGLHRPQGLKPLAMASSRVPVNSRLFDSFILPTAEHPGTWNFPELTFRM